jgi:uncharacterized lipoprotein YmbA
MKTAAYILAILGIIVILSGCGTSPPTRFYMVDTMETTMSSRAPRATDEMMLVAVAPVQVSQYLSRPQMITKIDAAEYSVDEFSRWMEPLSDNLSRTITENLTVLLAPDGMQVVPTERFITADRTVEIRAVRLHGAIGGEVVAVFRWTLLDQDNQLIATERVEYRQAADGEGYGGLVKAHTRIVDALSLDIADDIRRANEL